MGKKFELNEYVIRNILFDSNEMSIRAMAEKYGLNKNVIIRIIKQKKDINNIEYFICKKTKKILYDINNKSGQLTKHLNGLYLKYDIHTLNEYFEIKYENENYISFDKFLKNLNLKLEKKIIFNGLVKYYFKSKNRTIFFIDNKKIIENNKIRPILFYKLKNRYDNSIFFYEDEWVNSKKPVESKIKMVLGISKNPKIFARNCTILNIDSDEKNEFLSKNHIQGKVKSTIALGAYYNNLLVAVMTFNENRNMTNDENRFDYELNRFATDINYHVVGIGGKLFNYFLKHIEKNKTIVSYGDRRFVLNAQNNIYKKINFTLNQISKHDYYYINNSSINRIHKITMQMRFKNNINLNKEEKYGNLDYEKIWDCGKYRFIYRYE